MRLKSLELVGFKSFCEPTAINFNPGITAVVGPNGCGKSNVVDAIRWILGEQTASRLRGKTTEDLLYAGNDSRPAAGMAEVSLVVEAEEGGVLPEPCSSLSEVALTRRIYRSGESEYLINRIPCRLRDITEFFMAGQIHSRGYAIIEQGKIEEIIQARATDLRSLVEEAAGLSLFKGRREISERKLDRVKENLARLNDVAGEIERQLAFARRQAKKAEAYKIIKVELSELERLWAGRRLLNQSAEFELHRRRADELSDAIASARDQTNHAQKLAEEAAAQLQAHRQRFAAVGQEFENLRAGASQRARTRAVIERRLAAIAEEEPALRGRARELDEKTTSARAARAELGARLARENNTDDGDCARLGAVEADHEQALRLFEEAGREVELSKDRVAEVMSETGAIKSRLSDYAGERAEIEQQIAHDAEQGPALAETISSTSSDLAHAQAELGSHREHAAVCEQAQAAATDHEMDARAALDREAAATARARQLLAAAVRRSERRAPGGAGQCLRTIMDSLNGDGPAKQPLLLIDVVKAPAAVEQALHAVLGEQLNAVIVESPDFALRAIEILKETGSGRLSFVPESIPRLMHEEITAPGIAGRLIDKLAIEPGYESVAEALLGHVLLADDLAAALGASGLNGHGAVFATRDGDVIRPGGIISGGSLHGADGPSDEDPPLSAEEARREVVRCENAHKELEAQLTAARSERERHQGELAQSRRLCDGTERRIAQLQSALTQAEQRAALAQGHREAITKRLTELVALAADSNARLEELAGKEREARAELNILKNHFEARRQAVEASGNVLLELRSRFEARNNELGSLAQELRHIARLTDELESQLGENQEMLQRLDAERIDLGNELGGLTIQDEADKGRMAEIEAQKTQLDAAISVLATTAKEQTAGLERARERLAGLEGEALDSKLKCERAKTLCEEIARSFSEKFESEFESVRTEIESALDGRDEIEDERCLLELRAKLERIGEVNLAAESDVKELEERLGGLNLQRADLETAINDLAETVQKLNREARRRFIVTFEGAAKNFSEIFPKLMRGGQGHLELASPDNPLESGVNIFVQPAGKKVKEIGLLSGGEKALSALALVFSLFLLNPSPFCILDEVDAPLDEFSVAAFTGLVSDLRQRSQFIVITHNQRTMRVADHIHGVTMEQPGVSKLISLRLSSAA